ncbi:MAG: 50S ribosomal protein L11 methyltransferase [Planctomycetes bacterium]|jgi:ribosomal protein L11 methyltransferase|nr:50S ribosomal protein L11 methyltransferase [Planctomycetota bacterium]
MTKPSGPIRVGRFLVAGPDGPGAPPEPGVIALRIDPGRAFGDGAHPTTRLCLLAIGRHLEPGASVLDLGTGTGILAVAAALLGSGPVLAVDTDPEAVRAARENAAANGVTGTVRAERGSLKEVLEGSFGAPEAPFVVANILSNVVAGMLDRGLARAVAPGGLLALSGFLRPQTPEIIARLEPNGLVLAAREQEEDWVCVLARRAPR